MPKSPAAQATFPWLAAAHRATPLLAARTLNFGLSLASFALVARFLGPERFGAYILAYSMPWLLLPVVDFGFSPTITREIAASSAFGWARTAVRAGYVVFPAVVSLLLLASWGAGLRGDDLLLIGVGALQLAAFALRPAEGVLVAGKRTTELAIASATANVVSFIGVALATATRSHEAVVLATHIGYAMVYAVLTTRLAGSALKAAQAPPVSMLWREAWPFGMGGLAASIAERGAIPILVLVLGKEAAGLYGAAFRLYEVAVAVAGVGVMVVRPYLGEVSPRPEVLLARGADLLRGAIAVSGIMALWVAGLSRELVTWIYGPVYQGTEVAILGLVPALANVLPGNATAELGIASRSRAPYLQASSAAAVLSAVGTVQLSRWLGLAGPGVALALAGTLAILWIAYRVAPGRLAALYLRAMAAWCVLFALVRASFGLPEWARMGTTLGASLAFALWMWARRR
jgi:O-antigen/teichoic acid export membrane protein